MRGIIRPLTLILLLRASIHPSNVHLAVDMGLVASHINTCNKRGDTFSARLKNESCSCLELEALM